MKTLKDKEKALTDKIEFNLRNIRFLDPNSRTYKVGEQLIRDYALQYKKLTGEFYRRVWKWNQK